MKLGKAQRIPLQFMKPKSLLLLVWKTQASFRRKTPWSLLMKPMTLWLINNHQSLNVNSVSASLLRCRKPVPEPSSREGSKHLASKSLTTSTREEISVLISMSRTILSSSWTAKGHRSWFIVLLRITILSGIWQRNTIWSRSKTAKASTREGTWMGNVWLSLNRNLCVVWTTVEVRIPAVNKTVLIYSSHARLMANALTIKLLQELGDMASHAKDTRKPDSRPSTVRMIGNWRFTSVKLLLWSVDDVCCLSLHKKKLDEMLQELS